MPTDAHINRACGLAARVLLTVLALAGCALPDPGGNGPGLDADVRSRPAGADGTKSASGAQAASPYEPRYLRFRPDETQLLGALDDGRFTYLEFAGPVPGEIEFFDQDGRALQAASAGRVAAIQGVHAGVLVKRSERASFVSPNPRVSSLPRPPLPETADHGEARAKLENQGGQLQAMQRALEASRLWPATGPAEGRAPAGRIPAGSQRSLPPQPSQPNAPNAPNAPDAPDATTQAQRTRQLMQLLRTLKGDGPAPPPVPLTSANASAFAPERGLIRVFFATASRAIVAPDDGLGLLMREAGNADQVRVTGFTDATGSRAANDALALARADAVVQILLRRGIPAARIVSSAFGAEDYIADNASDSGRALNRRVEVLLLRNGMPLAFGPETRPVR